MYTEKFFLRAFGVTWLTMIALLSFVIVKNPSESGMAIGFLFMSAGMAYCHLSGKFD